MGGEGIDGTTTAGGLWTRTGTWETCQMDYGLMAGGNLDTGLPSRETTGLGTVRKKISRLKYFGMRT